MSKKQFAERLNLALDEIGAPTAYLERIEALAKLLKVHKFKAEALVNGELMPDESLRTLICNELDIKKEDLP